MNTPLIPVKYYIAEFSDQDSCIIDLELTQKEIDDMVVEGELAIAEEARQDWQSPNQDDQAQGWD
jgi:hypothetical protein